MSFVHRRAAVDTVADDILDDGPDSTKSFMEPAEDDLSKDSASTSEDVSAEDADSREPDDQEKLELLTLAVTRQPLNREVLYKILVDCEEERELSEMEDLIAAYPEFPDATQNQYRLLSILVDNYGLAYIERDAKGKEITDERRAALSEDELDDLIATQSYLTTPTGREFAKLHDPHARLLELLDLEPNRRETYIELLEYLDDQPRSYDEVTELLQGTPALETVINGIRQTMQPSVLLDKLERNGAVVWQDGWILTEAGKDYLTSLLS